MTSVTKTPHGLRSKFCSMQEDFSSGSSLNESFDAVKTEDTEKLVKYINDNVIGRNSTFLGPYGRRNVVFCDYNGSGRSLQFLEDYIQKEVLPSHGGSASSMCHTSLQSNLYREESRSLVRQSCGCTRADRVVLGGTPARLARALRARAPAVLVGPAEEPDSLRPWKECGATIVRVSETKEGFLDLNDLEAKLRAYSTSGRKLIGCFSAASRLTGALADTVATTLLLHQHGALAIWDYTLAVGGCRPDMNPELPGLEDDGMVKKDAAFFTCAALPGGAQAPSVLIVKESVLKQCSLIGEDAQDLLGNQEECGSVEAVRAGLVLQLKEAVGQQAISMRQDHITRQVLSHIRNIPELILLGGGAPSSRRLPVFSLLVRHPRGAFLHHRFVCAVLNDVFGVQASAGPSRGSADYGREVFGIDENLAKEYAKILGDDIQKHHYVALKALHSYNEHLRPGFCRISLPYFVSDTELAFVLEALKMVATEAWKILPQYVVDQETGEWTHRTHSPMKGIKKMSDICYGEGTMEYGEKPTTGQEAFPQTYYECLQMARNLFNSARKSAQRYPLTEQDIKFNARADYLRWYMLPKEAHDLLLGNSTNVKHIVPFDPLNSCSGRKSVASIQSGSNSPVPCGSPRHYSLSAIDTSQFAFFNKYIPPGKDSPLVEQPLIKPQAVRMEKISSSPVQFGIGEPVSPSPFYNAPVSNLIRAEFRMSRTRCHSLGSDSPPIPITPQTRYSMDNQPPYDKLNTCNCSSQTDLQSLDDMTNSPSSSFSYMYKENNSNSNSDCSQFGRSSPSVSVASQNSEDIQAYVKEMTRELATEIKSEIREVISQVEDVLENTDPVEISNFNNSFSRQRSDSNSVSVSDVADYLMGVSREMASEVKHEIREMVNKVDEMISPDVNSAGVSFYLSSPAASRKNSPPELVRRRPRSGSEISFVQRTKSAPLGLLENVSEVKIPLKKSPTSPILTMAVEETQLVPESEKGPIFFRALQKIGHQGDLPSPQRSPDSLPHDLPGLGSVSFNSSDTSSPDTIIQVLSTTTVAMNVPKSISSHKLSDDENSCTESDCQRLYCKNKTWYHTNSLSSQDSGINMSFHEHDGYHHDLVKRRPSSDSSFYKRKRSQNRLKNSNMTQRQEKSEVPDIIEGVPVCSDDYKSHYGRSDSSDQKSPGCRVDYDENDSRKDSRSSCATDCPGSKRSSRTSTISSLDSSDFSRKSSCNSDSFGSKKSSLNTASDDYARCSDPSCCRHLGSEMDNTTADVNTCNTCNTCITSRSRVSSDSSCSSNEYPPEFVFDEEGKWHCPPKSVWKGTVEAVQEFGMIRHQDKVLICLSGGAHSLTLLHTLHQYQFYARAKGIHFSIGAVTIQEGSGEIDPLHLMAYCKTLGVKFYFQDNFDQNIQCQASRKSSRDLDLCSFTNHWMRRQIYNAAAEHGYNVIATGQHLDDVAQSFIISVFNNGRLRTMKAHYFIRELNLRVIRPFIYVREKNLNQFVEVRRIPTFNSSQGNRTNQFSEVAGSSCGNSCMFGDTQESRKEVVKEISNILEIQEREKSASPASKVNRSLSAPCSSRGSVPPKTKGGRMRAASAPCAPPGPCSLLANQEALQPGLFASLKTALHPLISARNIEKDMKEYRHRKRSVIQMKNGAPVYNSDEGTDEEPVP